MYIYTYVYIYIYIYIFNISVNLVAEKFYLNLLNCLVKENQSLRYNIFCS